MSGFFDKLLSGRYPNAENVLLAEFRRVVDEVFAAPQPDDEEPDDFESLFEEPVQPAAALRGELERVTALLSEERSRLEEVRRELGVERAKRKALEYKLDRVLVAATASGLHEEPL